MASHPTSKARNKKQTLKQTYAKAREDAQLHGVIPTTPEGAVRDEVVNPATQALQDLTSLDRAAINKGWRVPDDEKPKVIQRLLDKLDDEELSGAEAAMIANALVKADQIQHERDNPEAQKGKGGVTINNQVNVVDIGEYVKRVRQQREGVIE